MQTFYGVLEIIVLSDFKKTYNEIPWNQIKALRNMVAHNYGKIDKETLWETISNDIPQLQKYCERIVKQFETMLQESVCVDEKQDSGDTKN